MSNSLKETISRPTGWLGRLYDEVDARSDKPIDDLEKIAQLALSEGTINEREYTILQYRIPFSGFERESLTQVGEKRLSGVTRARVQQIERESYLILINYLSRKQEEVDVLSLDIHRLPWRKLYRGPGIRVCNILENVLLEQGKPVTVGGIVELFNEAAKERGTLPKMGGYGQRTLEKIYGVFREVKIELSKLKPEKIVSLDEYLPEKGDVLSLGIHYLPWRELGTPGTRAYNALASGILKQCSPVTVAITVRDVLEFFNRAAKERGTLPKMRGYGLRALEITYEVFRKVNLDLPQVKVPY